MADISVVVPVYNGGAAFRDCLAALVAALAAFDGTAELIVVSDGSTDSSDDAARQAGAQLIRLAANSGPSRARNVGAAAARGGVLFFVDADVRVPPTILRQVCALLTAPNAPDAVIGSYDAQPAAVGAVSQFRNLLHHHVHQTSSPVARTFWGACGAVRRDVFVAAGGFDERRRWLEDIDLGYRMSALGYRILLDRTLQVTHLKRWTLAGMVVTDVFHRAVPWAVVLRRHAHVAAQDLNLGRTSRLSVALLGVGGLALAAGALFPLLWLVTLTCAVGLLLLNAPTYRFYARARGGRFVPRAILLHWLYYACGGLGMVLGSIWARWPGVASAPVALMPVPPSPEPSLERVR